MTTAVPSHTKSALPLNRPHAPSWMNHRRESRAFRASPRAQRRFHPEPLGHACHPRVIAERAASLHAESERLDLRGTVRTIHVCKPVARSIDRPIAKPSGQFRAALCSSPQAAPSPVFRLSDQLCSQGIAFHIPCNRQEMLIRLNGKGSEAALIDRARPSCPMVGMPTLRMGDSDPPEDLGEFSVPAWPEQQMPVSGHEAIGNDADASIGVGLGQDLFKTGVVSGCLKQGEPAHPTVQNMVGKVASGKTWTTGHRKSCSGRALVVSRKDSRPLWGRHILSVRPRSGILWPPGSFCGCWKSCGR